MLLKEILKPISSCPPLELVVRPLLPTELAAHYLALQPQSLRRWAATGSGPIKAVRIGRVLRWRTIDIKKLVGGSCDE